MAPQIVDWRSLPGDILLSIAKRLPTRIDIRRFRGVCTSWRLSTTDLSSPSIPSCVRLPIGNESVDVIIETLYKFSPKSNCRASPKRALLVLVREHENGKLLFHDAYTSIFEKSPRIDPNLSSYNVCELGKTCGPKDKIRKVVMLENDGDIIFAGIHETNLFMWRLVEGEWRTTVMNAASNLEDITTYKEGFCVLDSENNALLINNSMQFVGSLPSVGEFDNTVLKFLGRWSSELILCESSGDDWVSLHKLDEENGKWVKLSISNARGVRIWGTIYLLSKVDYDQLNSSFIFEMKARNPFEVLIFISVATIFLPSIFKLVRKYIDM